MESNIFTSKPNVLIEFGYLRRQLDRSNVWCIIDFPYEEIAKSIYLWPSDFISEIPKQIDKNNYKNDIRDVVNEFIKVQKR